MAIETILEDDRWAALDLDALAQTACTATLTHQNLDPDLFEISLLGCDDTQIASLNQDFRAKPTATNVLSWPSVERGADQPGQIPAPPEPGTPEMPEELGDIAISYDTCAQEAAQAGHQIVAHVTHLLVHGTLHLLGYDHITAQDGDLMESIETQVLATLGQPDPYRNH
ncbi:MAG: rRNA maturation RNase YbeY [Paracoccaceae bacterium]